MARQTIVREVRPADDWRAIYRLGAAMALVVFAGTLLDIVLTMLPGWGPTTVPVSASGWLQQLGTTPWLGMRNLDLLNAALSLIGLPVYIALFGAQRRLSGGLALLGLVIVAVGTAVFVASNAALPMLELARDYAAASAAGRPALEAAAEGLIARGAHGSPGAFPGFFISEVGTLAIAVALVRSRALGRATGWIAVVGSTVLVGYTVAITIAPGSETLMKGVAAPAGLLMLAWYVLVARGLWRLGAQSTAANV